MAENKTEPTLDELMDEYSRNPNADTFSKLAVAAHEELMKPVKLADGRVYDPRTKK